MITMLPEATEKLGVPRAVCIGTEIGSPLGEPGDSDGHVSALLYCLESAARLSKGEVMQEGPGTGSSH